MSLWTSGTLAQDAAGLTVSSWLVVAGTEGRLVAALDPDADLTERLEESGRAVVQLLTWPHRSIADVFAGTAPSPGGPFRSGAFVDTPFGPRLEGSSTWAGVSREEAVSLGWSRLVTVRIEHLEVGDGDWLVHRQGRYLRAEGAP